MDLLVQVCDSVFETFLVLLPRHTVYSGGRLALERQKARPEEFRGDVVQ
jgi:hypothetical protein